VPFSSKLPAGGLQLAANAAAFVKFPEWREIRQWKPMVHDAIYHIFTFWRCVSETLNLAFNERLMSCEALEGARRWMQ